VESVVIEEEDRPAVLVPLEELERHDYPSRPFTIHVNARPTHSGQGASCEPLVDVQGGRNHGRTERRPLWHMRERKVRPHGVAVLLYELEDGHAVRPLVVSGEGGAVRVPLPLPPGSALPVPDGPHGHQ
jgi:hypothetical protein